MIPSSLQEAAVRRPAAESGATLFVPDIDIQCCTVKPEKLLKNDGSIVTEIVKSVRLPNPTRKEEMKRSMMARRI